MCDETIKYSGPSNTLYERYRFHQRCQRNEEMLYEYVQDVIKLAATCDFRDYMDVLVRDRVLFGLHNEIVKRGIISAGGNPSLNDIIQTCDNFILTEKNGSESRGACGIFINEFP